METHIRGLKIEAKDNKKDPRYGPFEEQIEQQILEQR